VIGPSDSTESASPSWLTSIRTTPPCRVRLIS